jgi:hypothetical protein
MVENADDAGRCCSADAWWKILLVTFEGGGKCWKILVAGERWKILMMVEDVGGDGAGDGKSSGDDGSD